LRIRHRGYALAQLDDARIAHRRVAELRLTGRAEHDCSGRGVEYAELAFEPGLRIGDRSELHHDRTHDELYTRDCVGLQPVLIA
jgi:hypothetical protein